VISQSGDVLYPAWREKTVWERMDKSEKKKSYLLKAKEAEEEAAKAKDAGTRTSRLKLAESYRELAEEI
jgi:hypothetical protein